jgi:hypothetical protein
MKFYNFLGKNQNIQKIQDRLPCTGPGPFFGINEWAGEKKVVQCAHPSQPRTNTPHGWVSRDGLVVLGIGGNA